MSPAPPRPLFLLAHQQSQNIVIPHFLRNRRQSLPIIPHFPIGSSNLASGARLPRTAQYRGNIARRALLTCFTSAPLLYRIVQHPLQQGETIRLRSIREHGPGYPRASLDQKVRNAVATVEARNRERRGPRCGRGRHRRRSTDRVAKRRVAVLDVVAFGRVDQGVVADQDGDYFGAAGKRRVVVGHYVLVGAGDADLVVDVDRVGARDGAETGWAVVHNTACEVVMMGVSEEKLAEQGGVGASGAREAAEVGREKFGDVEDYFVGGCGEGHDTDCVVMAMVVVVVMMILGVMGVGVVMIEGS